MTRSIVALGLVASGLLGTVPRFPAAQPDRWGAAEEVGEAERAFAATMADRNHEAFVNLLSDEAVFFTDDEILRGKDAVANGWKRFFDGPAAPFAWEPERVEVLGSGSLAFSSGPVLDPRARRVGTFNSVWRREAAGWRIVFDKGCPPCNCD
jgi:ketosteroid isomerase-like protein